MKKIILFPILMIMLAFPAFVFSQTIVYQVSVNAVTSNGNTSYTFQVKHPTNNNLLSKTLVYYRFSDGYTLSATSTSSNPKASVTRSFSTSGQKKVAAYIIPKGGPVGYASLTYNSNQASTSATTSATIANASTQVPVPTNCLNISYSWHPYTSQTGMINIIDNAGASPLPMPQKPWFFLDVTTQVSNSGAIDISFDAAKFDPKKVIAAGQILNIEQQPPSPNPPSGYYAHKLSQGIIRIYYPSQVPLTNQRHFLIVFENLFTQASLLDKCTFSAIQSDNCNVSTTINIQGVPHDPNQTLVNRTTVCSMNANSSPWRYHIDFQNDGTAPTQNVAIRTYLDPAKVNLSTCSNITSSHGTPGIGPNTSTSLYFTLSNINLPGSNQINPEIPYAQTEGWIEFDVMPYSCLPVGTSSAYSTITFSTPGFSQSMNTNTVTTNIVMGLTNDTYCGAMESCYSKPGQTPTPSSNNYTIYPNPFTDQFTIQWPEGSEIQTETPVFQIMDATGRTCMLINWSEGQTQQQVDLSGFPAGMYLLYAPTKENGIAVTKIIKQ